MIKYYCDVCGNEIKRNYVTERLKRKLEINEKKIVAQISIAIDGIWNMGDLCYSCLMKVMSEGKE